MKGLSAWIAGTALAVSLVAPTIVSANKDREVRYYPSGQTIRYYPSAQGEEPCDEPMIMEEGAGASYAPTAAMYTSTVETAVPVAEPGMMIAGNRVYYISDNPRYDLSGSNESIYLVNDGTTYKAPTGRTATFAAAGVYPVQVAAVPAEYRQDWLAVAAGDRPVRCINAVGAGAVEAGTEAHMMTSSETPDAADRYTGASYTESGPRYVSRTQTRHVTHKRKSRAATSNGYFVRREPVETVSSETVETHTATAVAAEAPLGDLYQIGNSWYMLRGEEWSRSDSWRGPFFPVKKGHVPREVRESAKQDHTFDE